MPTTTSLPQPSPLAHAPAKLAMDTVPAVQMPHRFAGDAFPSAVKLSSSGEPEYLLDNSRKTTIAFKFNNGSLPSYLTRLPLGLLVLVDLQLEIEMEDGSWKEAKPVDFPGRIMQSGREMSVIRSQDRVTRRELASDGSVIFDAIVLNVLSSETSPKHRRLRFKVQPVGDDNAHMEELVAYSLGFFSVSHTISSKKAADERANGPSGPTEHARLREKKQAESERAAQAVHDGSYKSVEAALRSGDFENPSAMRTCRALNCLREAGATGHGEQPGDADRGDASNDENGGMGGEAETVCANTTVSPHPHPLDR